MLYFRPFATMKVHFGTIHNAAQYTEAELKEKGTQITKVVQAISAGITSDYDTDIAILKLDEPVKYTENIGPICLPTNEEPELPRDEKICYVAGWGLTKKGWLVLDKQKINYI